MNNFQKAQLIQERRQQTDERDTPELQEKRMKFLNWLCCRELKLPQVFEMYPAEEVIYGKKSIPQYLNEIKFANTRTQIATETRAEIDKLEFNKAISILCEVMGSLIRKQIHFCVFYAKGQRSPHIIIYDFDELSKFSDYQRTKAQAKFWRWITPFAFHYLDHSIWDLEHYVPLEFAIHWKYKTPFNLIFEYLPETLPARKVIEKPKVKRVYVSKPKKKSESPYYKPCPKCGFTSYLTTGNFFLCTNENCKNQEENQNAILTN